jgi:hypothetical protein
MILFTIFTGERPRLFSSKKKAFQFYEETTSNKDLKYSRFCEILSSGKVLNYEKKGNYFTLEASFQEIQVE